MNLFIGCPALAIDDISCSFRWLSDWRFMLNSVNSQGQGLQTNKLYAYITIDMFSHHQWSRQRIHIICELIITNTQCSVFIPSNPSQNSGQESGVYSWNSRFIKRSNTFVANHRNNLSRSQELSINTHIQMQTIFDFPSELWSDPVNLT